ncbi:MAG: flavin reductase family protein [Candidatus Atribacteria bacterium]|nr:MAG: flavin reductase family protein [Candidatus Atribacteria bacterium]
MKNVNYLSVAEEVIQQIKSKGAFLVVKSKDGEKINVMTMGWAAIGYMWRKPIMTIMVRKSRFTHRIIEKASSFTVSIPGDDLGEALNFCGTKSGRDVDKFKECNLITIPAQKVDTPIINISGFHYECKIVYKSETNPDFLCKEYRERFYADNDYHTFYFGEIVDCYKL